MTTRALKYLGSMLCIAITLLLPSITQAQKLDELIKPYPASLCAVCEQWDKPHEPFQIHGNSYYVGTDGLSSILITSEGGHVLLDGGLPSSAPKILKNIQALGFNPTDIKLILNSHAHYDHAGGIAAIQKASGARVAASPASAPVLEQGNSGPSDPQYGNLYDYPALENVGRFAFGKTLRVGSIALVPHATGGHTPGGTTWTWRSCQKDQCYNIVYADSQTPVSADGFRYSDSKAYPTAVQDFERGFATLEQLSCDIMISTHPAASNLWEKLAKGNLVDPQACKHYAAAARKLLAKRLETEKSGS